MSVSSTVRIQIVPISASHFNYGGRVLLGQSGVGYILHVTTTKLPTFAIILETNNTENLIIASNGSVFIHTKYFHQIYYTASEIET